MKRHKLVRDKIPEYLKKKCIPATFHVAGKREYWRELKKKLTEEVEEFLEAGSEEELADVLEVIDAVIAYKGFRKADLVKTMARKKKERGGFSKGIIWEGP